MLKTNQIYQADCSSIKYQNYLRNLHVIYSYLEVFVNFGRFSYFEKDGILKFCKIWYLQSLN